MKEKLKSIKPILKYFKDYKARLIFYSIGLFICHVAFVSTGYFIGRATEEATNKNVMLAVSFLLMYLFVEVFGNCFSYLFSYLFNKIQTVISRNIGYDVFMKTLRLPAYAFEKMSSGEIINRVTSDTEGLVYIFQKVISMLARIVSALLILVYIFMNSYIVGLEIIIFLFCYYFVVKHFTSTTKKLGEISKKESDKFSALTTESVRGIREIKTLGIINSVGKKMSKIVEKLTTSSINHTRENTIYDVVAMTMCAILEVGAFITCAILAATNQVSIAFFIAMTYYIYRYTWIIESVTDFSKDLSKLLVSFKRIGDIVDNETYKPVEYGNVNLKKVKGVIEFKNVTFNYPDEGTILNNFSIKFEPNKKIAIVGASGGGKTTIFNLLTRIFDTTKGLITIDGVDIKKLNEESLRKNISIIRQDPFIFNLSIKDNFRVINEKITLKEIRKYCKLASIDDYIMSLPKKYNTVLGEGGVNLSGGQKQRIAIARTLLKKSKIILMDEATSALDNASQKVIKDSIDALAKDHTVLIVAHRLSTIIDSDEIYVISNGKVLDHGTHESLMKSCKYYQKLHTVEDKIV